MVYACGASGKVPRAFLFSCSARNRQGLWWRFHAKISRVLCHKLLPKMGAISVPQTLRTRRIKRERTGCSSLRSLYMGTKRANMAACEGQWDRGHHAASDDEACEQNALRYAFLKSDAMNVFTQKTGGNFCPVCMTGTIHKTVAALKDDMDQSAAKIQKVGDTDDETESKKNEADDAPEHNSKGGEDDQQERDTSPDLTDKGQKAHVHPSLTPLVDHVQGFLDDAASVLKDRHGKVPAPFLLVPKLLSHLLVDNPNATTSEMVFKIGVMVDLVGLLLKTQL